MRILLIDSAPARRSAAAERLRAEGLEIAEASDLSSTCRLLRQGVTDAILLDLEMPDAAAPSLLRELADRRPDLPVLAVAPEDAVEAAVSAMKLGAADCLTRPFRPSHAAAVLRSLAASPAARHLPVQAAQLRERYGFDRIVARSPAMRELLRAARRISRSPVPTVLLRGESGTGKDLLARAIHYESVRGIRPFLNVTCTAIPETLLESELFGHEAGAFTDAQTAKRGLLEAAAGGTLFLDEIGDLPPPLQAKLLRALEERSFRKVGGTQELPADLCVVAATHRDLPSLIREGRFRQDLYYRLNLAEIEIPPLRDRPEDILPLLESFLRRFAREFDHDLAGLAPDAGDRLLDYAWPGNVRELRNAVERALLLGRGPLLGAEDLLPPGAAGARMLPLPPDGLNLARLERDLLVQALDRSRRNLSQTGLLLGLSRDQVYYRVAKYRL